MSLLLELPDLPGTELTLIERYFIDTDHWDIFDLYI